MESKSAPELRSVPCLTRYPGNPVLSAKDAPYPATLIFNAGVAKFQGRYVMVFRNDVGRWGDPHFDYTNIGLAYSNDGLHWEVQPKPCFQLESDEIRRAYDPRLTVIDGRCYMCFAVDTNHGVRGGVAVTDDFDRFEVLSLSAPDNRNMVLFPERINGRFARLERPFPVYGRGWNEYFDVWYSDSPDLRYWGGTELVLGAERVPFANAKIGPGAPPIKTRKGWLTTFHSVDIDPSRGQNGWEPTWTKRYCGGLMLLDMERPWIVKGLCRTPLIAPEMPYEAKEGFRTNVIFPGGMIQEDDGSVKIYYGAADTVECLATAHVDDLLALCEEV
ncbi:MAG: glycoside hydrolase family 130 protein [Chthoniobacteraceae bacterium]|nr:glycoside hydrolase family 130 protein [Chthoniobacteraceae bacterium]